MICLEVSVNGNVLCTAGTERGLVHVRLHHSALFAEACETVLDLHETVYRPPSTGDDLASKLKAALQHPERPASSNTVYWIDRKKLRPGDEITIKLLDLPADPATSTSEIRSE